MAMQQPITDCTIL